MSSYFKQVPDFEYVSRLPDAGISDYIKVKNLFKKGYLREDIFQDTTVFTKYEITGDDRPDNVAFDFYKDSSMDWLVLQCNNIINIQSEWPMSQQDFDRYLLDKYNNFPSPFTSAYDWLYNGVHHNETKEVKNSAGTVIVPAGLNVAAGIGVTFYDYFIDGETRAEKITTPVTNYEYESKIEDKKRNIFLLKQRYLNVVRDDMEEIMAYKKGSSQYVNGTLKRGENIRLYS